MPAWSYKIGDTTIQEDDLNRWWIYRAGQVYNSKSPYPLVSKALKEGWLTEDNIMEMCRVLGIPKEYILEEKK